MGAIRNILYRYARWNRSLCQECGAWLRDPLLPQRPASRLSARLYHSLEYRKRLPLSPYLETKGFDPLEDVKKAAAERWVKAVNAEGNFGHWLYSIARKPEEVIARLNEAMACIT